MSFNNIGPIIMGEETVTGVWLTLNEGQDFGAQWIMADPIGPGAFTVLNTGKEKKIKVPNQLTVVYWATIQRNGETNMFFLHGGGNT